MNWIAPQVRSRPLASPRRFLDRLGDALPLSAADRTEAALAVRAARRDAAAPSRAFGPAAASQVLWAERLFGPAAVPRPPADFRRRLEAQLLSAHAAQPAAGDRAAAAPTFRPGLRPLLIGMGSLCLAALLLAQPASLGAPLGASPTALAVTAPASVAPTGTYTPSARATATSHQVGRADGTAAAGG